MGYRVLSAQKWQLGAPFAQATDPYEEYLRERAADTNRGGFGAGVKYLGEKIGLGFLQSVEGIWDYTSGGIAKIFGQDEWAEQQFANDWVNYSDADEWFNPSEGWRVAGDVAGGIGTSLPAIAGVTLAAGITAISGGTLAPVAGGIISGSIAGLGAAGVSTKEAYRQTGDLGGKEFGYGALSGATEAGLELLSSGIGMGTGRIVKSLSGKTAEETAKQMAKGGVKSIAWAATKDFLGEAFEEGMSEILDPVYQRMTIDPNAQRATPQEVAYAALVGGLSGVIMGGTQQAISGGINTTRNLISGENAVKNGSVGSWMTAAERIAAENAKYSPDGNTGTLFTRISELHGQLSESLAATDGEVRTAKQKMLLGEMKRMETAATTLPYISRSVFDILADPQAVADKYNRMGFGNTITAADLTAGIDPNAEGKARGRQILKAIGKNRVLTTLAIADATGHLMTGAGQITDTVLSGNATSTPGFLNQNNINSFLETAKPAELEAVSKALGVSDVSKMTLSEFSAALAAYEQNGGAETGRSYRAAKTAALAIAEDAARNRLPASLRMQKDGAVRYRDGGTDVGVIKSGETFRFFDYADGELSRTLTRTEANKILRELKNAAATETASANRAGSQVLDGAAVSRFDGATDTAVQAAKIDSYLRENVPDYNNLNTKNRQAVRQVVRQAQDHGVSADTALLAARVAARSGLNISFDYNRGDAMNAGNSIILNPEAPAGRLRSQLLAHELNHVLARETGSKGKYGKNSGRKLIEDALLNMDEGKQNKIVEKYAGVVENQGYSTEEKLVIYGDEIASAYMEDIAADPAVWEYILAKEPTTKEKVLNFFRKSAQEYSFDEGMSREARKYLRHFKKLFDGFSARNFQGNTSAAPAFARMGESAQGAKEADVQNRNRFSIRDGKVIIDTDQQIFDGVERKDYGRTVRTYMRLHFRGKEINGTTFTRVGEGEYTSSEYTKKLLRQKQGTYEVKMRASTELDNMLRVSEYIGHEDAKHPHEYNGKGYDRYSVQFEIGGENFSGELLVAIGDNDKQIFYDVVKIKRTRETTSEGAIGKTDRLTELGTTGSGADSPVSPDAARKSGGKGARGAIGSEVGEAHTAQNRNAHASTTDSISRKSENVNRFEEKNSQKRKENSGKDPKNVRKETGSEKKTVKRTDENVRYALPETIEQDVTERYGKTYRWSETGYILQDGTRLDLSGRRDGAPGGYRTMDHRDIFADFDGDGGTDAMIAFMSRGNIRVSPEVPGINLQVEPTAAQYEKIADLVERLGWKEKSFSVDFDNQNGETVDTLDYEGNVSARKVVSDIRYYFKEGKVPQTSDLAKFRYALPDSIESYTDAERASIEAKKENSVAASYDDVLRFFENAISDTANESKKLFVGKLPRKTAIKILKETGINAFDKSIALNSHDIRHMVKGHGDASAELLRGQVAVTSDNFSCVIETIASPDEITADRNGKNGVLSLIFRKEIEGKSTAVTVFSEKKKTLTLKTAWITKKEQHISQSTNAEALIPTPEARSSMNAVPTNSIPKTSEKVNPSGKKSEKTMRYALQEQSVANYTEEQYNSFGWARVADAISSAELDDLYSKVQARSTLRTFKQSARGEAIVEVNGKPHITLDTDNVFVFVKGKKNDFTISRVVRFDVATETEMDNIRRDLYEGRSCSDTHLAVYTREGIAREYRREDISTFAEYSERRSNRKTSGGIDSHYRRSEKYGSGYSFHIGEDGEIIENFKDGQEVKKRYALPEVDANADTDGNADADVKTDVKGKAETAESADGEGKKSFTERLTARTVKAVTETLSSGSDVAEWRGKKLSAEVHDTEAVSHLFNRMITEPKTREKLAGKIADEIIRNTVTARLYGAAVKQSAMVQQSLMTAGVLGRYRGKLDLSGISAEVRETLGKRGNGFLLAYGAETGGVPISKVADELADAGIALNGTTDAELFAEIAELSSAAQKTLRNAAGKALTMEYGDDGNLTAAREKLTKEALSAFQTRGNAEKYEALRQKLKAKSAEITELRKNWYDVYRRNHYQAQTEARYNREANRAVAAAGKIREWKTGAFRNASELVPDSLIKPLGRLTKIAAAGNVNQIGTRRVVRDLLTWYQANADALKAGGYYSEAAVAAMQGCSSDSRAMSDAQWVMTENARIALEASGVSFDGLDEHETFVKMRQNYTVARLGADFDPAVRQTLAELADQKRLTFEELQNLNRTLSYFRNFTENYNKIYRDGKWQDATELAKNYVEILQKNKNVRTGWMRRLLAWYKTAFGDPKWLCRAADGYENGFFTQTLTDFRRGAINAAYMEMNLQRPVEKFFKENKKYAKKMAGETVNYRGTELTKPEAMQLYMTLKRDAGAIQVAYSGFTVREGKETLRLSGEFGKRQGVTMDDVLRFANGEAAKLRQAFTETDLQYISLLEDFYNGEGREIKRQKDMERLGYSNVSEGYYVPIESANTGSRIDTVSAPANLTLQSFNRSTTKDAKNELKIRPANEVFDGYVRGLAQYSELSGVFETYDRLYNADTAENARKPVSVKTEAVYVWEDADKYFRNLRDDMVGKSRDTDGFNRLFGKMRGAYAKAVLSLNPKVLLTQFSSVFASASVLDADCITKGMTMKVSFKDVDAYCRLAELRNYDQTAVRAQTITDKIGGVGDKLMAPIGAMDRFVVNRLFGACQQQVQKNGGAKVGTEENKIAAGKLLETVILETQQNTLATERTAGTRSASEVMKTLTMFKADQIKVFSRILDACGETIVLRRKLKSGDTAVSNYELNRLLRPENRTELQERLGMQDAEEVNALLAGENGETLLREKLNEVRKAELQSRLKAANRRVRMSIGALISSSLYMALVSLGFKWLYNRIDDEDDKLEIAKDTIVDAFGNLFGGLPILTDVVSYFTDGYDVSSPVFDMFNDLTGAVKGVFTSASGLITGGKTPQDMMSAAKDMAFVGAQFAGLPLKNAYKLSTGIVSKISTSAKYRVDGLFKNQNYRTDLSAAIASGDEKLTDTLLSLITGESGGQLGENGMKLIRNLLKNGYSALPRTIGDTVSVNGNEYELTDEQKELMRAINAGAYDEVERLAALSAFGTLGGTEQCKALKSLYDIYYDDAVERVLGEDTGNKGVLLARCMDAGTIAMVRVGISGIEADRTKDGKTVSGSKRKNIIRYIVRQKLTEKETLLLIYGLGYQLKDGEYHNLTAAAVKKRLLRYILRDQNLSQEERGRLAEQCGFTVKNGRIVSDSK